MSGEVFVPPFNRTCTFNSYNSKKILQSPQYHLLMFSEFFYQEGSGGFYPFIKKLREIGVKKRMLLLSREVGNLMEKWENRINVVNDVGIVIH